LAHAEEITAGIFQVELQNGDEPAKSGSNRVPKIPPETIDAEGSCALRPLCFLLEEVLS
jgi:hypothetical protein